jgi:hypothetical protein
MKAGEYLKSVARWGRFYEVQQRQKDHLGFLTHPDHALDQLEHCLGIARRAATDSTPSPMAASQASALRFI